MFYIARKYLYISGHFFNAENTIVCIVAIQMFWRWMSNKNNKKLKRIISNVEPKLIPIGTLYCIM